MIRTTKWVWIYGINTVNVTESKTGTSWDIEKQQMGYHVVGCSQSDGFHIRPVAMSVGGYPIENSNIFLKHQTREMLARFQLKDGFSIYPQKRWKIHPLLMGSHQLFRLGHFLYVKLPEGIVKLCLSCGWAAFGSSRALFNYRKWIPRVPVAPSEPPNSLTERNVDLTNRNGD